MMIYVSTTDGTVLTGLDWLHVIESCVSVG